MPRRNVVPKPASLSFEEAACLPTAWLTAYRMLFTQGGLKAGDTVLVQGAGGGVATALIMLARAGGLRVLRHQPRRGQAGAGARDRRARGLRVRRAAAGEGRRGHGDRRPRHLVALDPVAAPGRRRSSSPARPRGPKLDDAELTRIFFLQLRVIGSTMGTRAELGRRWSAARRHRHPAADRPDAADGPTRATGFAAMAERRRLRQDRRSPG